MLVLWWNLAPLHREDGPALIDWAVRHGIDPDDVTVPGWFLICAEHRQVTTLTYQRDVNGRLVWDESGHSAAKVISHVRLESPPLPLPGRWAVQALAVEVVHPAFYYGLTTEHPGRVDLTRGVHPCLT